MSGVVESLQAVVLLVLLQWGRVPVGLWFAVGLFWCVAVTHTQADPGGCAVTVCGHQPFIGC